jgi:multidrug efflux pump subunit AcrA (membrane-fusion protein)
VLGSANLDQPSGIVEIRAPVSGVITDQQVTNAAGVAGLGFPNPFTISDLTYVWILCDVYENDLSGVHLGEKAEIRLTAYPDKAFTGVISNVGSVLDPNIRTAKVRIEVRNPGLMRPGMFVTATFHGERKETRAAVPAAAILHLHDRDWIYVPEKDKQFRRIEVVGGDMLPGNMQEVVSGIAAGQQVVVRTPSNSRIRWNSNDSLPRRFRFEQPLSWSLSIALLLFVWGHYRIQETAGRSLSRRREYLGAGDYPVARPGRGRG